MNTIELELSGYAVAQETLAQDETALLRRELARLAPSEDRRSGIRSLGLKSEAIRAFAAEGPPAALAREVLGSGARPVKITGFDKSPEANWVVPGHQDLTIAVCERRDVEGFGPWSLKDDMPHVQPPAEILSRMLAVRVHLDDTPADHGALQRLTGTRGGFLGFYEGISRAQGGLLRACGRITGFRVGSGEPPQGPQGRRAGSAEFREG